MNYFYILGPYRLLLNTVGEDSPAPSVTNSNEDFMTKYSEVTQKYWAILEPYDTLTKNTELKFVVKV